VRVSRTGRCRLGDETTRRAIDLGLVLFFSVSVLYGVLFSLPEGLGVPVSPDSPWPPLRSLHAWAVQQEPAHVDPPPVLLASCLFDGLFQAPVLLFVMWGLARRRAWVRALGLFYAGAAITNMFFYLTTTFLGPTPPPHPAVYLPFNLPWLLAPALLAWRLLPAAPFARAGLAATGRRTAA
jgi:hypothetical protein